MLLRLEDSLFESNYVPLQNYLMEVNENKIRKAWQEKWKVIKGERGESEIIEKSKFIVDPDHLRKYGTLSNRNIPRKLKHTSTRFYGTVGARSAPAQRPSLFLSSVFVPSSPVIINQSNSSKSSTAFFSLQTANQISLDINGYMFNAGKLTNKRSGVPLNDLKIYNCNECCKEVRQNNLAFCKSCEDKKSLSRRKFSSQKKEPFASQNTISLDDPYNLMRRNRLGISEINERFKIKCEKKNANISPYHELSNKTNQMKRKPIKCKNKKEEEEEEEEKWIIKDNSIRRKSILDCDVNAYDLNKSKRIYAKNSNESDEDFPVALTELKILRPKLTKADVQKTTEPKQANEKLKTFTKTKKKSEIILNGQRCNILDKSHLSTHVVHKYLSDDRENEKSVTETLSLEPEFPKRPPRKQKGQALREVGLKYSKSKSKSSPNLSIKSILKKAIENENPSAVLNLFVKYKNSSDLSETDSLSEKLNVEILNSNNKKRIQNTLKKKVQFKMSNSGESVNQSSENDPDSTDKVGDNYFPSKIIDSSTPKEDTTTTNLVRRSKSCENLPVFSNHQIPFEHDNRNSVSDITRRDLHLKDNFSRESKLKKSFSERHLPFVVTSNKDDPPLDLLCNHNNSSCLSLFYDTMALRRRALSFDSRRMFQREENGSMNLKLPCQTIKKREKILSDKNHGNVITYEEFKKLTENPFYDKKPHSLRVSCKTNCTLNFSKESNQDNFFKKTKIKPPAPSPPHQEIIKSKKGETSLKVLAKKEEIEISPVQCNPKTSEKEKSREEEEKEEEEVIQNIPTTECDTKIEDGKTVVNFVTSSIKNSKKFALNIENSSFVTIQSTNNIEELEDHPKKQAFYAFNKLHLNDTNKVTISVRNENEHVEDCFNSSTCTIIETGSNSAVIPIVSTNNKTTLIVGSSPNVVNTGVLEQPSFNPVSPFEKKDDSKKIERPKQYFFSREDKSFEMEEETDILKMDPVEAVRRNLIPHICGKDDNNSNLKKEIKESRKAKEQKTIKPVSQIISPSFDNKEISVRDSSQSLAFNFQNEKTSLQQHCKIEPKLEDDSSSVISCSNSFCSTLNSSAKNSSTDTSRSNSFRSNNYGCLEGNLESNQVSPTSSQFYLSSDFDDLSRQEKDKLECEYEITNGLVDIKKTDLENFYEVLYDKFTQSKKNENTEKNVEEAKISLRHPTTLPSISKEMENHTSNKSIFEGASKYDILNYLVDAKQRVQEDSYLKDTQIGDDSESYKRLNFTEDKKVINEEIEKISFLFKGNPDIVRTSEVCFSNGMHQLKCFSEDLPAGSMPYEKESNKSTTDIERKDSGVGSETSNISRSKWQVSSNSKENVEHLCEDCDQIVETQITNSGVMYVPMICRKCSKKRSERKEIIQEIVETEEKYGRDLKIVLEEFCKPMLVAGLLTPDQLSAIFLNTEELLENSKQFTEKLKDTLEVAYEQGDEDLLTVNMGKLFLEIGPMLHAFESYCTRQGSAAILLANLEKEKELLRIFLRVSQMENSILRRMNLNSFLMVPVQRVTKYPLLLARLYKVTPSHHEGRELLKEAQRNIEIHLEHMNSETRDISAIKVWRRFSTPTITPRKSVIELELNNIKLRKMAIDVLDWNHEEVRFVVEGKLLYTQPTENNWKKGKTIKLAPIFALLVTLGKPNSKYKIDPRKHELTFPSKTGIREATILLLKEKCGRYSLLREPLYLDKIIVCCDSDMDDYFEVQELSTKDSFIFKSDDGEKTKEWYKQLQYHAQILGAWRKRRNALANIMINGMMAKVSLN